MFTKKTLVLNNERFMMYSIGILTIVIAEMRKQSCRQLWVARG
jgi:hypothetical protein